jgi:hypothetical protein
VYKSRLLVWVQTQNRLDEMYTWDVLFRKSNRAMVTLFSWVNRVGICGMATFRSGRWAVRWHFAAEYSASSSLNNLVEEHLDEPAAVPKKSCSRSTHIMLKRLMTNFWCLGNRTKCTWNAGSAWLKGNNYLSFLYIFRLSLWPILKF